jgi:hypothetical protein
VVEKLEEILMRFGEKIASTSEQERAGRPRALSAPIIVEKVGLPVRSPSEADSGSGKTRNNFKRFAENDVWVTG